MKKASCRILEYGIREIFPKTGISDVQRFGAIDCGFIIFVRLHVPFKKLSLLRAFITENFIACDFACLVISKSKIEINAQFCHISIKSY